MRFRHLLICFGVIAAAFFSVAAQGTVVVVDPTKTATADVILPSNLQAVFDKAVKAAGRKIASDTCEPQPEVAGVIDGAFSRAGAKQTLIFYQYCQTGNGLGWAGIVLVENGKAVGNFVADTGWTIAAGTVPDINQNGLDEFTLSYGGGMHQGEGGVGVDIMEFSAGRPVGLGWFQAEKFTDTETTAVWRVTAKPGKPPVYYKQKFLAPEGSKYRRTGGNLMFKLGKAVSAFEVVK